MVPVPPPHLYLPEATPALAGAGPVAEIPAGRGETVLVISDRANAGDLFQADAGFYFRIAGGFINISLNSFSALPAPVIELKHPSPATERAFLSFVRTAGVGAVIIERAWTSRWMRVFGRLGMRSTTVGGVTLYRTGYHASPGRPRTG